MLKPEIEISYFCFADGDYIRDVLIELGDQFEQDSITYAEPKGTFELIVGHSHYEDGKFLKTGQVIAEFDVGARYGASEGSMYSAIRGRPFQWAGWKPTKIQSAKLFKDSIYNKQKGIQASLATKSAWDKQLDYAISQISTNKRAIDKAIASCKEIFIKENELEVTKN